MFTQPNAHLGWNLFHPRFGCVNILQMTQLFNVLMEQSNCIYLARCVFWEKNVSCTHQETRTHTHTTQRMLEHNNKPFVTIVWITLQNICYPQSQGSDRSAVQTCLSCRKYCYRMVCYCKCRCHKISTSAHIIALSAAGVWACHKCNTEGRNLLLTLDERFKHAGCFISLG